MTTEKMKEERIRCPLTDTDITPVECMENRDIREECIPLTFKKKKDWKDICRQCKYYNY